MCLYQVQRVHPHGPPLLQLWQVLTHSALLPSRWLLDRPQLRVLCMRTGHNHPASRWVRTNLAGQLGPLPLCFLLPRLTWVRRGHNQHHTLLLNLFPRCCLGWVLQL